MADYYSVLNLPAGCADAEIKRAYRKNAIHWHPKRNQNKSKEIVEQKFQDISEAYAVLSDDKLRAIFDQFGAKGLKEGAVTAGGASVLPWTYSANPEEQFNDFFGSFSPFADFFSEDAGYANMFAGTQKTKGPKMDAQTNNLFCSLEELYTGCSKKEKVVRQKLKIDGKSSTPEERVMTVEIKAGWREGTKITFACEGDECKGCTTGDIVFILKETPHSRFRRNKHDLVYTANLSLVESLCGSALKIDTLDGRTLNIAVNEIVKPGDTKVIKGEGMPNPSGGKGDLVISFNVTYPDFLTDSQKVAIRETLS